MLFEGLNPGPHDSGAIRLDNTSDQPETITDLKVALPRANGEVDFQIWGGYFPLVIPPHKSAIFTQTAPIFPSGGAPPFDTSDFPFLSCAFVLNDGSYNAAAITVTLAGGLSKTLYDTGHILDTGGYDSVCQGNEAQAWHALGTVGNTQSANKLVLSPQQAQVPVNSPLSFTTQAQDASGLPLVNIAVTLNVVSGPNTGVNLQATTDANGNATFSYTSLVVGVDTFQAIVTNATGGSFTSNSTSVTWTSAGTPASTTVFMPTATPVSQVNNGLINPDFETCDLTGWTVVSGNEWNNADVTSFDFAQTGNGQFFNKHGKCHLWGYAAAGDGPQGVLQSSTFTLTGNGQISFLNAGGTDINNLYVALVRAADGVELFKATGYNAETYQRVYWDASAYLGQALYFKVVDAASGSGGHVNLDDIVLSSDSTVPSPTPTQIVTSQPSPTPSPTVLPPTSLTVPGCLDLVP